MPKSYQDALNDIYSSYMAVKDKIKGLHDHAVRNPDRIIEIARTLEVLPNSEHVIRITGSKGKGTTSRLIAKYLHAATNKNVGLLVSPEEYEHTDRISFNGNSISQEEFVDIYNFLHPYLQTSNLSPERKEYFSPSGIFLLIGLIWFKRKNTEFFVLEGGRGVIKDEVGAIASYISVITSILFEHSTELGPEIEDIAREKLAIGLNSGWVVMGHTAIKQNQDLRIIPDKKIISPLSSNNTDRLPQWLLENDSFARAAVSKFIEKYKIVLPSIPIEHISPSFGHFRIDQTDCVFEALINLESLDRGLWNSLRQQYKKITVILSLPDDKDRHGLLDFFTNEKVRIVEVALEGTRGYLRYEQAHNSPYPVLFCNYDDSNSFQESLKQLLQDKDHSEFIYVAGTQTFIRLFKKSFLFPDYELRKSKAV